MYRIYEDENLKMLASGLEWEVMERVCEKVLRVNKGSQISPIEIEKLAKYSSQTREANAYFIENPIHPKDYYGKEIDNNLGQFLLKVQFYKVKIAKIQ